MKKIHVSTNKKIKKYNTQKHTQINKKKKRQENIKINI